MTPRRALLPIAALAMVATPLMTAACAAAAPGTPVARAATSSRALAGLVAAERAFNARAAGLAPAQALGTMFADDVRMSVGGQWVRGKAAVIAALAASPINAGTGARWTSIKQGLSSDGRHGFTLGHLEVAGGDPAVARRGYLAYWVRDKAGWRVMLLRQMPIPPAATLLADQPPTIPATGRAGVPPQGKAARAGLIAAEQAFSDRAQIVGTGDAFAEFGRPDAIFLGGRGMVLGAAAIGAQFNANRKGPAPIHWSADEVLIAPSGDLGATIGTIRRNTPPADGSGASIPFFTVWMRDGARGPWRYIAE